MNYSRELTQIYDLLFDCYGPQHWWPGETSDEIIIGALLTQNTNWKNVEKAINNLASNNLLSFESIKESPVELLARCIKPSGYYNQKAIRLKEIAAFFYKIDYQEFKILPITRIRNDLLSLKGIGLETADSILLYAFDKPIFVIDTYTKRLFHRLGFFPQNISYDKAQDFFMQHLPLENKLFNEYHALIVRHAKEYCQKISRCKDCFLLRTCHYT